MKKDSQDIKIQFILTIPKILIQTLLSKKVAVKRRYFAGFGNFSIKIVLFAPGQWQKAFFRQGAYSSLLLTVTHLFPANSAQFLPGFCLWFQAHTGKRKA